MSEVSQETINRALLGDPEAVRICTKSNYALPCSVCGGEVYRRVIDHPDDNIAYECDICGYGNEKDYELSDWNYRPDLRAAAKEVYAPKWLEYECDNFDKMPPTDEMVMIIGEGMKSPVVAYWHKGGFLTPEAGGDYNIGYQVEGYVTNNVTHWMPLLELPEVSHE